MKKTDGKKRIGKGRMIALGLFAAFAATGLCFTSCTTTTSDGIDPVSGVEGEPTKMSITIPKVTTYAADPNAKATEVVVKTVDVYVYGGTLEKHVSLAYPADFDLVDDNKYVMKNSIEVLSGTKRIYVGINLPAAAKAVIEGSGGVQGVYSATGLALRNAISDATDGFAMFSVNTAANTTFTIAAGVVDPRTTHENEFTITVARLAAKATVRKAPTLSTSPNNTASGATFLTTATGDLTFCMGNVNTKLYPLQKVTSGIIEDPNYDSNYSTYGADFVHDFGTNTSIISAAYADADDDGTAVASRVSKYTVENTSDVPYLQGLMSYVSIRAKFRPDQIVTAFTPGQTDSLTRPANTVVQNDLYVYITAGGEYLYFTNAAIGSAWGTATPSASYLGNYKDGYCYYLVYLDPKTEYSAPYAAVRNFYYDSRITKFNALGYSNPEPPDPENPLGTITLITVDVLIQPWTLVESDTELGGL
ncbi:MAG: Mfa1 family fimbria major subunit [Tannerella sp.]|jgi:hypothetical protein|nr:Mfa1 family fimbria major subunit [Tannerella sp.]